MQKKHFHPLVVIEHHMSDGPGYTGPIVLGFGPERSAIVYRNELRTGLVYLEAETPPDLPHAVGVVEVDESFRLRVYEALGEDSKEYLDENPKYMGDVDMVGVKWSDGREGAAIIWGSSVHASAVFLPQDTSSLGTEVSLDCDVGMPDEQPVAVEDVVDRLVAPFDVKALGLKG